MAQAVAFQAALQRLGFPQAAVDGLAANGITSTDDLIGLTEKDTAQVLKIIRTGNPPVTVPYIAQKRFNIFCFWVNRRQRLNEPIGAALFDQAALDTYGRLMTFETQEDDATTTVKAPAEFKTGSKWKPFKEGVIAYLNSVKGNHNIPLAYVIRENEVPDPNAIYQSEHHRLISVAPLAGMEYGDDNGKVFDCLKSWTLNGPAWTWMRAHNSTRNGRAGWLALVAHYEGDAQRDRVKDNAYAAIAAAKYHGERKKFSFETYVTIHQEAYADLIQYGEVISEEKRVRDLLQGIKDNSASANAAKGTVLATPTLRNNFNNAVAHLATTLQLSMSLNDSRNISLANTGGRGRGGRDSNRGGRGGRGRGRGRNTYLGSYSPEQWRKLSREEKQKVFEGRQKSAEQRSQAQASVGGRNQGVGRGVAAVVVQPPDFDSQSQLTGYVTNANANISNLQAHGGNSMEPSILQGTLNGSAAVGDKRPNTDSAGSFMSRRRTSICVTSDRRSISHMKRKSNKELKELPDIVHSTCELDSHADTCVAGPNCLVLEYTDQVVNVSAYSDQLDTMQNIPIVTAATALDDLLNGTTIILILGQALYMGDKVKTTLLCPNQMRAQGIIVDDVPLHLAPKNKPSTHSIYSPDDDFEIPLTMKGIFSCFATRTPTWDEIETCRHVKLTNEFSWDPHSGDFQEQELHLAEHLTGDYNILPEYRSIMQVTQKPQMDDNIALLFFDELSLRHVVSTNTSGRSNTTTAEQLSRNWNIGLEAAKRTLKVTTQKGIRHTTQPIEQRFRTRQSQLRYNQLGGRHGRFYTDTFFSSVPTLNGNTMAQVYTNDHGYSKVYPMKLKSQTHETLSTFIHEVGIPSAIHSDDAKEIMQGRFKELCKEYHIPCSYTEPFSPWQNRAEGAIRELKRHTRRKMASSQVPERLWDFCAKWSSDVRNKTSSNRYALEGRTPYEAIHGHTPDISSIVAFNFYEPVWYYDQQAEYPKPKRKLARWLGEAYNIGQAMCYWVVPKSGIPIARSTVQGIPREVTDTTEFKEELKTLDEVLVKKYGEPVATEVSSSLETNEGYDINSPMLETPVYDPIEPKASMQDEDDWEPETFDQYISAQVILPSQDGQLLGTVTSRKRDLQGNPVGVSNKNPILDTRIYEVTFPDGHTAEFSANVIAECLYSQVDPEGRAYSIFEEIVDWRKTKDAIEDHDIFQVSHNGNIHRRRTTKGYQLCVRWADGSTSWEALKDMKETYPTQVADFAVAQQLEDLPAFRWWVPQTLKRRDSMISAIKTRFKKKTHKYGIQVPHNIEEAYLIDKETGTDYWHQAVLKEMKNNAVAFKFLEEGEQAPVGSTWIPFHMIFDVKCDLTRKARYVAGGHWTQPTSQITYSSVVTRESIRIAFLIAALNDLEILSADIGNAYLQAPVRERVHTTAGPEFGPTRQGQTVIIVRAMYGLKSSGAAWHAQLSETLYGMDFKPTLADPDVWYRAAVTDNGKEYYEYILVYVDDILVLSHAPRAIMETIRKQYRLKEEPVAPKVYLGASIKPWSIPNEPKPVWSMNSTNYIKEALRVLEIELTKAGLTLKGKPATPMQANYRPELDVSPVLGPDQASYYMSLIGILRWAVELGRIDIYISVALLSSYLCQPRVGHLEQVYHIFAYLKCHEMSNIVFDPNYVVWDDEPFHKGDWSEFYKDAKEQVPPNALPPRGRPVQINAFVDADHAGNKVTRRSHTGILIYLNCAPIIWYSKAQSTVECSTFGSEFVALRICVEMIEELRYKLRMFGIPIDGPANVFCDNKSVVTNASTPTSTLKKKHNAIAYHKVREAVAAGILRIAKVHTSENLADLLTKPLPAPALKNLIQKILW